MGEKCLSSGSNTSSHADSQVVSAGDITENNDGKRSRLSFGRKKLIALAVSMAAVVALAAGAIFAFGDGGGAGTAGGGGGISVGAISHAYAWDDDWFHLPRIPTHGWEEDSIQRFHDEVMKDKQGGLPIGDGPGIYYGYSKYVEAAHKALNEARERGKARLRAKGSSQEEIDAVKAWVIGVGWSYTVASSGSATYGALDAYIYTDEMLGRPSTWELRSVDWDKPWDGQIGSPSRRDYIYELYKNEVGHVNSQAFVVIAVSTGDFDDTGWMNLTKSTLHNYSWVKNNRMYSLAGAKYALYESEDDARADRNRKKFKDENGNQLTEMTTDANGNAGLIEVDVGKYYVREVAPAKGHYMEKDEQGRDRVRQIEIKASNTKTNPKFLAVEDSAASDPAAVKMYKQDSGTKRPLSGAQFTVKYYDVVATSTAALANETPKATWVVETGKCRQQFSGGPWSGIDYSQDKWAGFAALDPHWLVESKSDPLYFMANGDVTVPLGTYTIQETKAPDGYHLTNGSSNLSTEPDIFVTTIELTSAQQMAGLTSGTTLTPRAPSYYVNGTAIDGTTTAWPTVSEMKSMVGESDQAKRANAYLYKADRDIWELLFKPQPGKELSTSISEFTAEGNARDLSGATFKIINRSGYDVTRPKDNSVAHNGEEVCTITTDAKGYAATNVPSVNGWSMTQLCTDCGGALQPGTYEVVEVTSPANYLVNTRWRGVITIPEDIKGDSTDMIEVDYTNWGFTPHTP